MRTVNHCVNIILTSYLRNFPTICRQNHMIDQIGFLACFDCMGYKRMVSELP